MKNSARVPSVAKICLSGMMTVGALSNWASSRNGCLLKFFADSL